LGGKKMKALLLACSALLVSAPAIADAPVIDNAGVTVWDVPLPSMFCCTVSLIERNASLFFM
jgi:hypothetical protein